MQFGKGGIELPEFGQRAGSLSRHCSCPGRLGADLKIRGEEIVNDRCYVVCTWTSATSLETKGAEGRLFSLLAVSDPICRRTSQIEKDVPGKLADRMGAESTGPIIHLIF